MTKISYNPPDQALNVWLKTRITFNVRQRMRRISIIIFALLPIMTYSKNNLWGPIDAQKWEATPCVVGRLASEQDVKEGKAVFYISGDLSGVKPIGISLPACALYHEVASKEATPVILIQAEETPKAQTIGFRFISGGNGVCTLAELEILKGPNEKFK